MKKTIRMMVVLSIIISLVVIIGSKHKTERIFSGPQSVTEREISGVIKKGDTFSGLFSDNNLHVADLRQAQEATDGVYNLGRLSKGRPYRIVVDDEDRLRSLTYWVDDETFLDISRDGESLNAALQSVEYESRPISLGGTINDNLISSMGTGRDALQLALDLSDIFAWDIDFNTDLRKGDTFRVVVEGLYHENIFKKFGPILSAEFVNSGRTFVAYRFEKDGSASYYDADGRPFEKAFLKAPLNFRRISSNFSRNRYHPILKRNRPHYGIDYVAPTGTAVMALGDGTVQFAGRRGDYGNLIIVKHKNGYSTYYGHLSAFRKGLGARRKVSQGDVIGYVGATGLATGPHLHFEMRVNGTPVNPNKVKLARKEPLPPEYREQFARLVARMDRRLAATSIADGPLLPALVVKGRHLQEG